MAVYQPHQAHKCIRNEQTYDSAGDIEIESCHDENCEAHGTAAAHLNFGQSPSTDR